MPFFGNDRPLAGQGNPLAGQGNPLAGQGNPLAQQDADLFGQDRELQELYDALAQAQMGEMMEEMTQPQTLKDLWEMRNASGTGGVGGAMGNMNPDEVEKLMEALHGNNRKQLSPERIHNLGVLYGEPLSQARLDYFEDMLNRDPNESYMGEFPEFPK